MDEALKTALQRLLRRVVVVGRFTDDPAAEGKWFLFSAHENNPFGEYFPLAGVGNKTYQSAVEHLDPRLAGLDVGRLDQDNWFFQDGEGQPLGGRHLFVRV